MTPTSEMNMLREECVPLEPKVIKLPNFPEPLTLREQAAIAAMQGIITSNCDEYRYLIAESYSEHETHLLTVGIARMAVACADALIEELNKD